MPERLIEGSPAFKTWASDVVPSGDEKWGQIAIGVWEATPGTTISVKGETLEYCQILTGKVEITEDDGGAVYNFGAGDAFVMKPSFTGVWKTIETVRKIYLVASQVS